MIIECIRCHTRANLPESKEGAKVRCPECGNVYVARPVGARGKSAEDPTKYFIIGGAVVLLAVVGYIASQGGSNEPPPVDTGPKPKQEEARVDRGFNSPLAKRARAMHDWALAGDVTSLLGAIDFDAVHAWLKATSKEDPPQGNFLALPPEQQAAFRSGVAADLIEGRWKDLVADWLPYDGSVIELTSDYAVVRLQCNHKDASQGLPDRWVQWRLVPHGKEWMASSWERWYPEGPPKPRKKKPVVRRTLSDGSQVIEGEVRTDIAYHEDTSEELRREIEAMIDQMVDIDNDEPRLVSQAGLRLEEIGKHAVPGLLCRLGSIPLGTQKAAIQLNLIHMKLRDIIVDWDATFEVHTAMGATSERQESGIKQWFGWYDLNYERFWRTYDKRMNEDPFWDDPDFQPRNEKERREFEKLRREYEAAKEAEDDS